MILNGKRLLITGGAKRIGREIVSHLARCGCKIALHCHTSGAEAETLLSSLPGSGHSLHIADLADADAPEKLFAEAGKVDLLVNNAAIFFRPGSPEDLAAAEMYDKINFQVPRRLLELFSGQNLECGAAVNITDSAVLMPGSGAYYESKLALTQLTAQLALPWAARKLRINAIAPGAVLPPAWAPRSRMEKILSDTPLHQATLPPDIAHLTAFLLSCDTITGTVIPLDGGLHLKKGHLTK